MPYKTERRQAVVKYLHIRSNDRFGFKLLVKNHGPNKDVCDDGEQ